MRVLLTGATGYIGKRLLPLLLAQGHEVICCVRDQKRFHPSDENSSQVTIIEVDFLNQKSFPVVSTPIDVAFFLIHGMTTGTKKFDKLESDMAGNFITFAESIQVKQVIYLGGIVNEAVLSRHLQSRLTVENILRQGKFHLTVLRAGIVVGSGSASFEIIRDLVEKLPIMITPQWVLTPTQPISVKNVEEFLLGVMLRPECFDETFDIGGPEVLTYKEMLLQYAQVRGLNRRIITLPFMTPKLSSYWLYFITSTPYSLAINLANSMKIKVVCKDNRLEQILGLELISYREAVKRAFGKIASNSVISSWKDALGNSGTINLLNKYAEVPVYGCYFDEKRVRILPNGRKSAMERIWSIGGNTGWYYANSLWRFRGFIDRLLGGVGLRRGRTNDSTINPGDVIDFWRVILADQEKCRLLLFAEMRLPGEAWLEFKICTIDNYDYLIQRATYRPKGVIGRLYWFLLIPFHFFIFKGMARRIAGKP